MHIISKAIYNLSVRTYITGIRVASLFNDKAHKWITGRKHWDSQLMQKIPKKGADIWIHCASLGEFEQGRPVIEALRRENPGLFILLTFFSPSGYEVRKNYPEADIVYYLPADTPKNAEKFLSMVQPKLTIFVKYEFWYHFISKLQQQKRPVILISGIFRENQFFFKSYGRLFLKLLKGYTHLFVQDKKSALLIEKYGVHNYSIVGDTRFDRVAALTQSSNRFPEIEQFIDGKTCWIAGSTWPKDEQIIKTAIHKIPKWIIAPHEIHEAHLKDIENLFGKDIIRYSVLLKNQEAGKASGILLLDTIGILSSIYKLGKAAYIGGGFGKGIHNTLEAAVNAIPVLFGPNYHKFEEAKNLIACGGAFTFKDENEFNKIVTQLTDNSFSNAAGKKAKEYVNHNLGSTKKIVYYIQEKRFLINA